MKAIITKYHGPTNTRGSRISAKAEGVPSVSIGYPHALREGEQAHSAAALMLCHKYGWEGTLVAGGLPDQRGYAFCFITKDVYRYAK